MKIASTISRYLLGVIFLIFGLNGFLHFIPMGAMPSGPAGEFMSAIIASGYYVPIFAVQLLGAILLLANRYVPLGLTLLAPVIVNIFFFHLLMFPGGLVLAVVVVVLWLLAAVNVWPAFSGILRARA